MEMLRVIERLSKAANKAANLLGNLILFFMLVILLAGVIFRYVLHSPLPWTDETAMILVVWMVFFGASIGVKERTHVGTEAFLSFFPFFVTKIIFLVIDLLIAFFAAYLIVFGWKISIVGAGQRTIYWGIPYFYLYLSISVGGFLMLIQAITIIIDDLQRLKKSKNPD